MRRGTLATAFFLVAAGGAAAAGPWFAVELARPADAYTLLARGVWVVEARADFALAVVSAEQAGALDGFRYTDLGVPSGPVYLAWPRPGGELPALAGVTTLGRFGDTYVVSGEVAAVEKLAAAGVEIKRVGLEPIEPPRRFGYPTLAYDPLVAAAVARVRDDRYFGHIENLAAIPTRFSHAEEIEQATAYIEGQFQQLGYETARWPYSYNLTDNDYLFDCVFRAGGRLGWLLSSWGYVWRSDDYGATWTPYKSEGKGAQGKFVTDSTGFVVGGKGFLARTDDGGLTWRQLTLDNPDDELRDIYFYDTTRGMAAGKAGAVYRTVDGGASWHRVTTPTTKDINGIYAETADRWWAVGVSALVLRSDDNGASWYKVDIPAAENHTLRQMAFADATHAVIVGGDGTILYSADGGASWQRVSGYYPEWPYFTEVAFADATRGWAVGGDGKVYRTDDAGASWSQQTTPLGTACCYEGLSVLSRDEAWAAGYPAALIHTSDGGANWQQVDIKSNYGITWYNVEATKRGQTRPDEIYILCGHYDCISEDPWNRAPGAEDNGSGTAALLEAAAALADFRFDATIKLVAFSGEEEGLIGSRAYARAAADAGDDIRGVFNMDMVSYLDEPPHDVEVRYNDFSQGLLEAYQDAARLYVPDYLIYPATGGFGGSDHESFWQYGYPALLSIEYPGVQFYPWYHSTADLPEHLTAAFGGDVTRVNLAAAASLAGPREGPSSSSGGVVAYPNPAKPSRGHDHIHFGNLAPGSNLTLYDLGGAKVWSAAVGAGGSVDWPLATAGGDAAASGVYLFVVEDAGGARTFGKVAVVN